MSLSLIRGCEAAAGKKAPPPPLLPLFKGDMEEFKVRPLSCLFCVRSAARCRERGTESCVSLRANVKSLFTSRVTLRGGRERGAGGCAGGGGAALKGRVLQRPCAVNTRLTDTHLFITAKLASDGKRETGFEMNVQGNQVSRLVFRVIRVHVLRGPRAAVHF